MHHIRGGRATSAASRDHSTRTKSPTTVEYRTRCGQAFRLRSISRPRNEVPFAGYGGRQRSADWLDVVRIQGRFSAPLRGGERHPHISHHDVRGAYGRWVPHVMPTRGRHSSRLEFETQASELIGALRVSGDPSQIDLAARLWRCQQGRQDRRRGLISQWPPMCRSPACAYCRRWLSRKWQSRAAYRMAHADNNCCYLVTIVVARSGALDAVREIIRSLRTELRNLRHRNARNDARWRNVEMVGQTEIEALGPDDILLLPPHRRRVVDALPAVGGSSGYATWDQMVVWVVHVHIACYAPGIHQYDLLEVLRGQWPGPAERVDVRPFLEGDAGDNTGRIIGYASKHDMRVKLRDFHDLVWPLSVQAAYWGWLHSLRNGLGPLRLRLGKMRCAEE